jgi:hypothetical protein
VSILKFKLSVLYNLMNICEATESLKRISTLLEPNAWHKSYKANISYNFASDEASEIDEVKLYYN